MCEFQESATPLLNPDASQHCLNIVEEELMCRVKQGNETLAGSGHREALLSLHRVRPYFVRV